METIVTKSYQGAQTRLLLPKVKDVAGVIGDNNSTKICFKIPKNYATGWLKYIEFDCYVIRDDTEIKPSYLLDEHDSFIVPYEITESNIGKEVDYCLKLVSEDGEIVEKSELATLYFRDSCNGTNTEPEPYVDIVTLLYNNAFCNVSYSDPTDGAEQPQLTFTPLNPNGEPESVSLNIPYLDAQGHIPPSFIDKEIVVEIFKISTPDELITLEDAQIPDMALISEGDPSEPYYMDLYMLVGSDPTDIDNWYLIHTSNPVFTSIQTTDLTATNGDITVLSSENITAESISATSIEGTFSGDLTGNVTGNVTGDVTGNVTGNLSGNATTATTADNYNTTQGGIKDALGGKAPVNHASDATTYGVGSTSQYGHVKVDNSMSDSSTNPVQNSVIRAFVNSSIATSTANFIDTFDAVTDLGFQQSEVDSWGNEPTAQQKSDINTAIKSKLQALSIVPTNNDYLFVAVNRSTTVDIDSYWRFKYTEAVTPAIWKFEYPLNNSSFTQAQWDDINSLVTNTSDPKVGVDVKDINAHMGNSKIHVPANTTAGQVLTSQSDGQPIWQTPPADTKVRQRLTNGDANRPIILSSASISTSTENVDEISYRNNSIYANPSTGSIHATKVYSNASEVVNLADPQTISGIKSFTGPIVHTNNVAINGGALLFNTSQGTYKEIQFSDTTNSVRAIYIRALPSITENAIQIQAFKPGDGTYRASQIMSIVTTSDGISYAEAPWRGANNYASMGTSEIITKGALQASTDVVHRSGDESIAGIKTFSNYSVGLVRQTITVRAPTDAEITAGTIWFQIYTHINTSTACKMRVRAYSRHDSFEFVVGMGGSGSGGSVTSGGFIHRTNSSRRVVFANDGTNVKMYVNGINSAGGYVLTVEQLASDGYAGTSDINSFPLTYSDTPIAYPTTAGGFSNIVELTDLTVSTGYSQTIGGSKTFTSTQIINMSLPQLYLKHTTDDYTQATTSIDTKYFIGYQDKNGQDVFHMSEFTYNGGRAMSIANTNKVNGNTVGSSINLYTPATGSGYVTASYRPYASTGNTDVLVKAHVTDMLTAATNVVHTTGDEEINGIKTFGQGIIAYPEGWHSCATTTPQNKWGIFAKITCSSIGAYHIFEFTQSSNTATTYGRLMVHEQTNVPSPVWLERAGQGANNPLAYSNDIVVLSDGTDLYLAWRCLPPYGRLVCRESFGMSYSAVRSINYNVTYYTNEQATILDNLDNYTVYEPLDYTVNVSRAQTIGGDKTFADALIKSGTKDNTYITLKDAFYDYPTAANQEPFLRITDSSGNLIGQLCIRQNASGTHSFRVVLRNSDQTTYKTVDLVTSD